MWYLQSHYLKAKPWESTSKTSGLPVNELSIQSEAFELEKINIYSFAEDEADPAKRWHRLSRLLDGKRVMFRIGGLLKVKLETERGALAGHIAALQLIDLLLTAWINNIYATAL